MVFLHTTYGLKRIPLTLPSPLSGKSEGEGELMDYDISYTWYCSPLSGKSEGEGVFG